MSVEPQKPQGHHSPPFIATAPALESLALLDRGLGAREPIVLVTGEPGVGKSTLVREALRRWGARVCSRSIVSGEATAETLFAVLLGRFGGTTNSQASGPALAQRLTDAIAHAAQGGTLAMVVVENAHLAAPDLLLQLVNVADMVRRQPCAFEVLLVGAPELSARLNDPALAAFAAKVAAHVRLSPLTQADTRHYLLQRSGLETGLATGPGAQPSGMFSRKACRDIHGATFGIIREIEALADEAARRAARAEATTISPDHVRSAVQSLRSRRGNSPSTVIPLRAERANTSRPNPAGAKPAPVSPPPAAMASANGAGALVEPPKSATSTPAAAKPPRPAAATPAPAAAPEARKPERQAPQKADTRAAATSDEQKSQASNDQRVKDWVSRFGGSGAVRIGVGHGMPRYEESATLDVPARRTGVPDAAARAENTPPATTSRILIVDQEPPLPPELVARLSKLSKKKRRRGPSTTIQGAALAIAVALLVVVLARHAGFGKRMGFEATDTSTSPIAAPVPAPPLALGAQEQSGATSKPHSAKSTKPVPAKRSEPVAKATRKPAPKQPVASAPASAESLPAIPYRVASSTPVQTLIPPDASARGDESPALAAHKFGIIAGSFPSGDMAKAEKDHLARLVPYRVWVDKTKVQGVRTYQLMVGRFDTMEHAWDSAQVLMRRGLIRDANVRLLTEREAR